MSDVDNLLNAEQLALAKDQEIERILGCCQWDYFDLLEIDPNEQDIPLKVKKTFRRKTLLVHPDKVSNKKAPVAFDRIKRAERVLSVNPETTSESDKPLLVERERLLAIYKDASTRADQKNKKQIVKLVEEILNDEIKLEQIEKDFERRQEANKIEELNKIRKERELKKKLESKWEDDRDVRVLNWRKYTSKVEKKNTKSKKVKKKVLA